MAQTRIYSVRDEMVGKYHNPTFIAEGEHSEEEAIRIFKMSVNGNPLWNNSPNDFTLYQIGTFDDETGVFTTCKKEIIGAKAVKGKE